MRKCRLKKWLSGLVCTFQVREHQSRRPLSRVESGAKPPGGSEKSASPRTPSCPCGVGRAAAYAGRLWLRRVSFNFRFQRKKPFSKSPRRPFWGFVQPHRRDGKLFGTLRAVPRNGPLPFVLDVYFALRRPQRYGMIKGTKKRDEVPPKSPLDIPSNMGHNKQVNTLAH